MKKITAIIITAAILSACGGDKKNGGDTDSVPSSSVGNSKKFAVKGTIVSAVAECFDKNKTFIEKTSTDENGAFKFTKCPSDGFIQISDGTDLSTGQLAADMYAMADSTYITPVTMLEYLNKISELDKKYYDENLVKLAKTTNPLTIGNADSRKLVKLAVMLDTMTKAVRQKDSRQTVRTSIETLAVSYAKQGENKKITDLATANTETIITEMFDGLDTDQKPATAVLDALKIAVKKTDIIMQIQDKIPGGMKGIFNNLYNTLFGKIGKAGDVYGQPKMDSDGNPESVTIEIKGALKRYYKTNKTKIAVHYISVEKGTVVNDTTTGWADFDTASKKIDVKITDNAFMNELQSKDMYIRFKDSSKNPVKSYYFKTKNLM